VYRITRPRLICPIHRPCLYHISVLVGRDDYTQCKSPTWRTYASGVGVEVLAVSEGRPQMQNKTVTAREDVSRKFQVRRHSLRNALTYIFM
jgi:hypothetical protein